jgi:predicted XRE-type DNA-binding protein
MPKPKRARATSPKVIDKKPLAAEIARIIDDRGLNQTEAAEVMRDAASQVSQVVNGRLDGFSPERLMRMLTLLGRDVDIRITRSARGQGKVRVRAG